MAVLSGALMWALLSSILPSPLRSASTGPVLETVAPSQLAAMGVRLEHTLQPSELPDPLPAMGLRLPGTVLLRAEAEATIRTSARGVQETIESTLTYATVTGHAARSRATTIVHRLVWVVVGTRADAGLNSGLLPMLWLVDARSPRLLIELTVPGVQRGVGGPGSPGRLPQGGIPPSDLGPVGAQPVHSGP